MQESGPARPREHVLDRLVRRALALDPAVPLHARVLRLLLARYAGGRDDLADTIGVDLAAWLDAAPSTEPTPLSLRLALDAEALSTDERLAAEVSRLVAEVRKAWGVAATVEEAMVGIEACLLASDREHPGRSAAGLLADSIDEIERVVAASYRPGAGIAHRVGEHERGNLADHSAAASALLAAFDRTGRLPYSMLAEELMQSARSASAVPIALSGFIALCRTASVFRRLAVLHADSGYRAAAVVAPDCDYAAEARAISTRLGDALSEQNLEDAAEYGLLLSEWPDLQ